MVATASRLGLMGPLGADPLPQGAHAGSAYAARLERELLEDAAQAWDTPRLATALVWWESFLIVSDRTMFFDAHGAAAPTGHRWNRRSLDLFARHILTSPPLGRTRGEHVSQDVADSYASTIYLLRCRTAGYDIAPRELSYVAPLAAKTRKRAEPLAGTRRLAMGFRATRFIAAAAGGFDRSSARGEERWAAGLLSHNALLRGGEVGVSDDAHHEPHRILRGRSVSWRPAARASAGRLWVLVWIVPIKDPTCAHKGYPTPVARRHDGPLGADHLCTYDALARLWWRRIGGSLPFPVDAEGKPQDRWWERGDDSAALHLPLFLAPDGRVWRTSTTRSLFRDLATAACLDPASFGAKSGRIGGATDARDRTGDAGRHIVQRRVRWASDVAEVYQRELLAVQLDLSASLGDAVGEDLEQLCAGWAQPAHR